MVSFSLFLLQRWHRAKPRTLPSLIFPQLPLFSVFTIARSVPTCPDVKTGRGDHAVHPDTIAEGTADPDPPGILPVDRIDFLARNLPILNTQWEDRRPLACHWKPTSDMLDYNTVYGMSLPRRVISTMRQLEQENASLRASQLSQVAPEEDAAESPREEPPPAAGTTDESGVDTPRRLPSGHFTLHSPLQPPYQHRQSFQGCHFHPNTTSQTRTNPTQALIWIFHPPDQTD